MKLLQVLIFCLAVAALNATTRRHRTSHLLGHKHKIVPSASDLHNHFGSSKAAHRYGPKPINYKQTQIFMHHDGHKQILGKSIPEGCDIKKASYFEICYSVETCDLCAIHAQCGWCQSSNSCLPNCALHECEKTMVFDQQKCVNQITKGCRPTGNIAPDAKKWINPELDGEPKQRIVKHKIGLHNVYKKEAVSTSQGRQVVHAWNKDKNMIIEAEADVPLANYGVNEKIEVYHGTETETRHGVTGEPLSHVSGPVKTHGIDTAPVRNAPAAAPAAQPAAQPAAEPAAEPEQQTPEAAARR